MAPRKIIQDSDDEEDIASAQVSPIKAVRNHDNTIIDSSGSRPVQPSEQSADPSTGSTEILAREIHNAHHRLTEISPEDRISSHDTTITQRPSSSPIVSRKKRGKTTIGILDDVSSVGGGKLMKVYGSKSSSANDFEFAGVEKKSRDDSRDGGKPVRDEWEFPGSSASNDPLAMSRVKSRNAMRNAVPVSSDSVSGRNRTSQVSPAHEGPEVHERVLKYTKRQSDQLDSSQSDEELRPQKLLRRRKTVDGDIVGHIERLSSSLEHDRSVHPTDNLGSLAQPSFQIDLTDPALALTTSQREQYRQMSASTSISGSLPPPQADQTMFIDPFVKFSDESSTIMNTTPLERLQDDDNIAPTSSSVKVTEMSISTIPSQTPSKASQKDSERSSTPRRPKTIEGLQSPNNHISTSSALASQTHTSISKAQPKRRFKTTTNAESPQKVREASLDDLSLPAPVHDVMSSKPHKSKNKRKATDFDDDKHMEELGSDDSAIGLPKEQYKPRPSRSRGNTAVDELIENIDFSKRPEALMKAKKRRRKTNEGGPQISQEVVTCQPVQDVEDLMAERPVDTKGDITRQPEKDATPKENVLEEAEPKIRAAKKPPKSKRKPTVNNEDELAGKTNDVQQEQDLPGFTPTPDTKEPPPKPRGRPRKKTQENLIQTTTSNAPSANKHAVPPSDDVMLANLPKRQNPLQDTDLNSSSTPNPSHITHPDPSLNPPTPPPEQQKQTSPPQLQTPQKPAPKGPDKHSPINSGKVPYRVGLSRRARIEPLLRVVRK